MRARYHHHLRLSGGDVYKTNRIVYKFAVKPFGFSLVMASSSFHRLVMPFLRKDVRVFSDEILVYSIVGLWTVAEPEKYVCGVLILR